MADCPTCEYHKQRAQIWRDEAYRLAGHPLPRKETSMTQDEMIELARQAGFAEPERIISTDTVRCVPDLAYFAELVAAKEREVVANWIMNKGFATGHGDSIVDLLDQLEWQIEEKEREACADLCEQYGFNNHCGITTDVIATEIRARGQA